MRRQEEGLWEYNHAIEGLELFQPFLAHLRAETGLLSAGESYVQGQVEMLVDPNCPRIGLLCYRERTIESIRLRNASSTSVSGDFDFGR